MQKGQQARKKVGRPSTSKPYRKNVIRVSAVEDLLEELIERVPARSEAKKILEDELNSFRMREIEKALKRAVSVE